VRILFEAGEMVTATVSLADEMIELIAETLGAQVLLVEPGSEQEVEFLAMLSDDDDEDDALLEPRAPVVTVLGHVDHGKTTLLDTIRHANVVAGEAGGSRRASVPTAVLRSTPDGDRFITFIDTPGHEAFTAHASRGAQATDIAILVVAADDGVMPQTLEAISHARAAEVPIVVAVTRSTATTPTRRVCASSSPRTKLVPEEWGGDTIVVDVSAPTGQGVDALLEQVMNVADIELSDEHRRQPEEKAAVPQCSKRNSTRAAAQSSRCSSRKAPCTSATRSSRAVRGAVVRAMFDESGQAVTEAGPSVPVEVLGLADVPMAGDEVRVAPNDKVARTVAEARAHRRKAAALRNPLMLAGGARLEDVFAAVQRGEVATLNLVVKADSQGSLEAITDALRKLDQEHDEVRLSFVHRGVGGITSPTPTSRSCRTPRSSASTCVPTAKRVSSPSKRTWRCVSTKSSTTCSKTPQQRARRLCSSPSSKKWSRARPKSARSSASRASARSPVAWCRHGVITRGSKVRFLRDGTVIWKGAIASLRRFKDDVRGSPRGLRVRYRPSRTTRP